MRAHLSAFRRAAGPLTRLALLVALASCRTSPEPHRAAREDEQRGEEGTVTMRDGRDYAGELLVVRDSTLTVLVGGRLLVARVSDVARLRFGGFSSGRLSKRLSMSAELYQKGREASRFPFGLSQPVERALLEQARQSAPDTIRIGGRSDAADSTTFLAGARAGARRYESREAAIDDGFTRVGAEFPAMGEHWVSFARVMEDSVVAARPSILTYVESPTGPRLVGVAYTKLLAPFEDPPSFPLAGAWHEHNGTVDEESLPLGHAAPAHDAGAPEGMTQSVDSPRLAVLHAWIHAPNPAGSFVTENWTLPFVRRGIQPPALGWRDAAHALALVDAPDGQLRSALRSTLSLTARDDSLAAAILDRHHARAAHEDHETRAAGRLAPDAAHRLAEIWSSTWSELEEALPDRASAIRRLSLRL